MTIIFFEKIGEDTKYSAEIKSKKSGKEGGGCGK